MLDSRLHAGDQLRVELQPVVDADGRGKPPFVRRAENRAPLAEDARRVLVRQRNEADRIDEPFIAFEKADDFVAVRIGALHHAADHGVKARAIAAGREDADPLATSHVLSPISARTAGHGSLVGHGRLLPGWKPASLGYAL